MAPFRNHCFVAEPEYYFSHRFAPCQLPVKNGTFSRNGKLYRTSRPQRHKVAYVTFSPLDMAISALPPVDVTNRSFSPLAYFYDRVSDSYIGTYFTLVFL